MWLLGSELSNTKKKTTLFSVIWKWIIGKKPWPVNCDYQNIFSMTAFSKAPFALFVFCLSYPEILGSKRCQCFKVPSLLERGVYSISWMVNSVWCDTLVSNIWIFLCSKAIKTKIAIPTLYWGFVLLLHYFRCIIF